jgi:hypothetical protein
MNMEHEIANLIAGLQARNSGIRLDSTERLYDVLDYGGPGPAQQARIIAALLDALAEEPNPGLYEPMLHTLLHGTQRYDDDLIPFAWEKLRGVLGRLGPNELEHALIILGRCNWPDMEAEICPYLQHANELVREAAREAIEEIHARLRQTRDG